MRRRALTVTVVPDGPTGSIDADDSIEMVFRPAARLGRSCAAVTDECRDTVAFDEAFHELPPPVKATRLGESGTPAFAASLPPHGTSIAAATRTALSALIVAVRHALMESQ